MSDAPETISPGRRVNLIALIVIAILLAALYAGIQTALDDAAFQFLATAALVILAGTSAPLLTRFMENPGQVGPSFYNEVNLPIALLIAILLYRPTGLFGTGQVEKV